MMKLVKPSMDYLPGFKAALETGWSPDNVRLEIAAREQLAKIAKDAEGFVASLDDREAKGDLITLPDGTQVKRLPGYFRWMWDGEFCGSIGFRWSPGTSSLPPHCLGHIGYSVVPWKRGKGYATSALGQILPEAKAEGLTYVELTTDPDNVASQQVIAANGGLMLGPRTEAAAYGNKTSLLWRINLG
ncbi:MAG TPA: GNAT family N-acetyltransferase [Alphaproteobacteria bacterium]